jgi:hypothetical protein
MHDHNKQGMIIHIQWTTHLILIMAKNFLCSEEWIDVNLQACDRKSIQEVIPGAKIWAERKHGMF